MEHLKMAVDDQVYLLSHVILDEAMVRIETEHLVIGEELGRLPVEKQWFETGGDSVFEFHF